jgi:hypothetical protein
MPSIQVVLQQVTIFSTLMYLGIGFAIWYFVYGFEVWMNGGHHGRGRGWVFACFFEEMQWFLPGGLAKRTDYIRKMVDPKILSNAPGFIAAYHYKDIREQNLYEKVAKETLGNGFYFWGLHVALSFFLWPLLLPVVALIISFNFGIRVSKYLYSLATGYKKPPLF